MISTAFRRQYSPRTVAIWRDIARRSRAWCRTRCGRGLVTQRIRQFADIVGDWRVWWRRRTAAWATSPVIAWAEGSCYRVIPPRIEVITRSLYRARGDAPLHASSSFLRQAPIL